MKFRKGMNRVAWFLMLGSWFVGAAVVLFGAIGQLPGASDRDLYSFALIMAVVGLGLFLAIRGVAWVMSAFIEG